jgi:hypothetical protein
MSVSLALLAQRALEARRRRRCRLAQLASASFRRRTKALFGDRCLVELLLLDAHQRRA